MNFIKKKLNHLNESNKSYKKHLFGAIKNGFLLIITGIVSIIHGIFPFLFTSFSAKTIINIYYDELHFHYNKEYREYIQNKIEKLSQ
jgi:hypothetical protein